MEHTILANWDEEAGVWIATSDTVPGLVLESGSFDALIEKVRFTVPELLRLNKIPDENIRLFFKSERHEKAYA